MQSSMNFTGLQKTLFAASVHNEAHPAVLITQAYHGPWVWSP